MDGLTEGRIVHFVIRENEHRAAMIVRVWNKTSGVVNLNVFTDWYNDVKNGDGSKLQSGDMWIPSCEYSENCEVNTWHWIEKA